MARTKRTPDVEQVIVDAIRFGSSHRDAHKAAGISGETFYQWLKRFPDFSDKVMRAEGQCLSRMSARVYQEAVKEDGDWRAALEYLKRRNREDWGDSIDLRKLSDEDLIARAATALAGVSAPGPDATQGE